MIRFRDRENHMQSPPKTTPQRLVDPVIEEDHAIGPADAPITIIEYGDYECPTCLNAVPMVKEIRRLLGDRLRFVFRHFPQSSIHPHASAAAEAAEAAADQGKFWEMHQALFDHQKELADLDLSHLALRLGMEIYKFDSSRSNQVHRRRIAEDYAGGLRSNVRKTPTFFVNGVRYDGAADAKAIVEFAESVSPSRG
jgi:protein-disulfide isomerase